MRDMNWMHLIFVWLLMVISVILTCHNKLNCTFNFPWWASPHSTFKLGIVSRVDVLDNEGSSSFDFNSSFVKWGNVRIFSDTLTVINYQADKCIIYQNTIDNELNVIMWISVVPHQVGITTIVKVAWIWGSWVKRTSALPKIDNHKHNILSPWVRIIFKKKGF